MQNGVSYEHLCPVSFIQRSAIAYPNKTAVAYKDKTLTYAQLYERSKKLAGALQNAGIRKGDKVAAFLPNIPPMLEAHFGPMYIGAAIVAVNIRLSPREVGYILDHSGSKALIFDSEFAPVVREALPQAKGVETVVQVVDEAPAPTTSRAWTTRRSSRAARRTPSASTSNPSSTPSLSTTRRARRGCPRVSNTTPAGPI